MSWYRRLFLLNHRVHLMAARMAILSKLSLTGRFCYANFLLVKIVNISACVMFASYQYFLFHSLSLFFTFRKPEVYP